MKHRWPGKLLVTLATALNLSCRESAQPVAIPPGSPPPPPALLHKEPESSQPRPRKPDNPVSYKRRSKMVEDQLRGRDIKDERVLEAMRRVPRHEFVAAELRPLAYEDQPLPIGQGQTISQPYIVALMTQLAGPRPGDRCLDVGTGSGYQAAVLAELSHQVYSVEIHEELAIEAAALLKRLGYDNVTIQWGDGYEGWPEHAPFDVIVLAAATPVVPPQLIKQLAPGGRLVLPLGEENQTLILYRKDKHGKISEREVTPVRFVPMTGAVRGEPSPEDAPTRPPPNLE